MKKIFTALIMLLAATSVESAFAQSQRLVLNMSDLPYHTIPLKQEIKRLYPYMNLQDMELQRVRVVAKSKHGQGSVALMVAGMREDSSRLMGNPYDFSVNAPYTFDRVDLYSFSHFQGPWQLHLRGNIIVRRVVVFVNDMSWRRHRRFDGPGDRFGGGYRGPIGPGYGGRRGRRFGRGYRGPIGPGYGGRRGRRGHL